MLGIRIGLSGKMSSGKSLVASYLVKNHGFTELSFAARLKQIVREMFDIDVDKKDERARSVLQQFAQHSREIDPLVWVRYIIRRLPDTGNVVISDVRFGNEFSTLQHIGFTMVRMMMDRPTQEEFIAKTYPGLPLILLDDQSETELDNYPFDYYIDNGGTVPLADVYKQVDMLVQQLKEADNGK